MSASAGNYVGDPANDSEMVGFRVVQVPEPTTLSLLALGGLLLVRRRAVRVQPILLAACLLLGTSGLASADVLNMGGTRNADGSWTGLASLENVPVGHAGNAADSTGYGTVNCDYRIGKYEVTAGQYCQFLNTVAGVDTYGLYSTNMWTGTYGCKIERFAGNGTTESPYQYRIATTYANRPVNYVSFWDACRFANWLHNGQLSGAQSGSTTEDGAYTLTAGGISNNTVSRNATAEWAVASENEWYKAAYYNPATNSYYDFPTSSNTININMANFFTTVGHTTDAGSYACSSPYGTFDQGGNVWEWHDALRYDSNRGLRGGSFDGSINAMRAQVGTLYSDSLNENHAIGFRVVQVPEPATLSLLALGSLLLVRRRQA